MSNHLINETSPYLLQHAHNPVNWYPWGDEALEKAKSEDKPIFLSIGYAACHWCHVMERESFENETIADIMNEHFVNVKVDREERPDLDQIYMSAVVAMTGQGGWPMSVWLTPEGVPIYGGTYFPPTDRGGLPGFGRLLESLVNFYHRQKDAMQKQSEQILSRMESGFSFQNENTSLDPALTEKAAQTILRNLDREHGGTRGAPKFPQPMVYDFLLRWHANTQNPDLLEAVELTLQKMAQGGVYDQLGGGFHRYSTDSEWLAPHFEKMLYDNALLARLYLHAYQATDKDAYRQIVEETLDYVIREMTHPDGGFYATQDADSEGVEGKFFVWTAAEVLYILGDTAAKHFDKAFDVTRKGNWEGKNILRQKRPLADVAAEFDMPLDAFLVELAASKKLLFDYREQRVKPARDEKVLTAWNGLMLAAFAEAGQVLNREDYLGIARKNAQFVLDNLQTAEGRLLRTWKDGQAKLNAYLEDYAFFADGLLALYQSTFDESYFVEAQRLMDTVLTHFSDIETGGFFDTADDHPKLVVRPKDVQDNAIPSGNAMAIRNLLYLATFTGADKYYQPAFAALSAIQNIAGQYPSGFSHWLGAIVFAQAPVKEIALIGEKESSAMQALLQVAQQGYHPNQVIALSSIETETTAVPLLNHRAALNGLPTAYLCQNFSCQLPVNSPEDLAKQLLA